jgi:hypothetical protein
MINNFCCFFFLLHIMTINWQLCFATVWIKLFTSIDQRLFYWLAYWNLHADGSQISVTRLALCFWKCKLSKYRRHGWLHGDHFFSLGVWIFQLCTLWALTFLCLITPLQTPSSVDFGICNSSPENVYLVHCLLIPLSYLQNNRKKCLVCLDGFNCSYYTSSNEWMVSE